jgi:hypothetical protein
MSGNGINLGRNRLAARPAGIGRRRGRTYIPASDARQAMTGNPVRFRKMNGLGNEILVLDARREKVAVTPAAARAIAAQPRTHFDQPMVLSDRARLARRYVLSATAMAPSRFRGNGMAQRRGSCRDGTTRGVRSAAGLSTARGRATG